jgi:hypothetical protein
MEQKIFILHHVTSFDLVDFPRRPTSSHRKDLILPMSLLGLHVSKFGTAAIDSYMDNLAMATHCGCPYNLAPTFYFLL